VLGGRGRVWARSPDPAIDDDRSAMDRVGQRIRSRPKSGRGTPGRQASSNGMGRRPATPVSSQDHRSRPLAHGPAATGPLTGARRTLQRSLEHSGSGKRQSKHNTLCAALVTIAATLTLLIRRSPDSLGSLEKSPWVPGSLLLVSVRARYRRSRPCGMATDPGSADAGASAARGRRRRGAVGLACGTLADGSGQSGTAADRPS
jgi:hypothetical protein